MKLLVEKKFKLFEVRTETEFDTPNCGLTKVRRTGTTRHGLYATLSAARAQRTKLVRKYCADGWRVVRDSNPTTIHLTGTDVSLDLYLTITEEIVSQTPVK